MKLAILFHTGDGFSSPGLIQRIATRHPHLTIILGHLREGCMSPLKECASVYVETSSTLPNLVELAADIDSDRILFGSDIPYYRYPTQISIVEATRIPQKTKNKIFYDNSKMLLEEKQK